MAVTESDRLALHEKMKDATATIVTVVYAG